MGYDVGDRVVDKENGITGTVKKFYHPTACGVQTMIVCDDGREYHAPSDCFVDLRYADLSKLLKNPQIAMSAAMSFRKEHGSSQCRMEQCQDC